VQNNSELTELDGLQTATVDFDTKLATVTLIKVQTPESLTKVVQATGDGKTYTVSNEIVNTISIHKKTSQ
jgi:Cu+-exporting ATPase